MGIPHFAMKSGAVGTQFFTYRLTYHVHLLIVKFYYSSCVTTLRFYRGHERNPAGTRWRLHPLPFGSFGCLGHPLEQEQSL